MGVPQDFLFIGIFIFLWLRSSYKNLKPYDTPLCHFSNGGWFIGVILPVHWGYIAGSLGLYCRFIGVILPVHRGYIPVHWGYIFEKKIVAYGMLSDTVCTAPLGPIWWCMIWCMISYHVSYHISYIISYHISYKIPTLLILAIDVDRTSQKLNLEIHKQGKGGGTCP